MDDPPYELSTGFQMIQPLVSGRKEVGDKLFGQQGTPAKLSVGLNFWKSVSREIQTHDHHHAERPC